MNDTFEEILELLYVQEEQTNKVGQDDIARMRPGLEAPLTEMAEQGLIVISGDEITLTDSGRIRARQIVRLHRLAERLLQDVLEIRGKASEAQACHFEHCLTTEVAESICTLLGHPTTCPHGRNIPPGECCKRNGENVEPVAVPLTELECGVDARVLYLSTRRHDRLDRLATMGILPGVQVRLHQRMPSYVLEIGETTLAIDEAIARDIFVRQLRTGGGHRSGWGFGRQRRRRGGS